MIRHNDDGGAVAVTVALLLVVLVLMAGFVLDLGLARFDRHTTQTAADLAATAAVIGLDTDTPMGYQDACVRAVTYFWANSDLASPVDEHACEVKFPSGWLCDPSSPETAIVEAPPYEIAITIPVDLSNYSTLQEANPEVDGEPCDRVGVRIVRERDYLFGAVAGFDGARPASDAVARTTADGTDPEYATLVILDPHGCPVVRTNGGPAAIIIENLYQDGDFFSGIITVDSDASDDGCGYPLDMSGAAPGRICAGVEPLVATAIFEASSSGGRPPCDSTPETLLTEAQPDAVAAAARFTSSPPQVEPYPTRRGRITRQPIDHRYNCRDDYYSPGYADAQGARHYPVDEPDDTDVQPCGSNGTRPGHVDDLVAAYGGKTRAQMVALGFAVIQGEGCSPNGDGTYPSGNYFINCPNGQGFFVKPGVTHDFVGPGTVVFAGPITQKGFLRINSSDTDDSIVYVQSGDIDDTGGAGATEIHRTFVYVESGTTTLKGNTVWDAPLSLPYDLLDDAGTVIETGLCTYAALSAPLAACFRNLAFWSNSFDQHDLGGGGQLELEGIFFSPNAGRSADNDNFRLHGGPGYRLTSAQFFTYKLELNGSSVLTMRPDPSRFVATPIIGGGLIR